MRKFVVDIESDRKCNLACSYCVIPFESAKIKDIPYGTQTALINLVKECLKNPQFTSQYPEIQLSFFGGEPTLNKPGIKQITDAFDLEPRVKYFLYSNGFKYNKEMYDILLRYKDTNKFATQISYDGLASHDRARVDKRGKGSALAVKETIYKLQELGVEYSIHPTISSPDFDCLAQNYFEFKRMRETGIDCLYSPTIDYLSKFEFSNDEIQGIKETLKSEFRKILPSAIEFYKINGYFDFGWFNPQKAICAAGNGYVGLDIEGRVLPCHGNFSSSNKDTLSWGSVDTLTPQILMEMSLKYDEILNYIPKECAECNTHYCLKCNAAKYEISQLQGDQRWVDYTNQPGLCAIFKFIGYYRMAIFGKFPELANIT